MKSNNIQKITLTALSFLLISSFSTPSFAAGIDASEKTQIFSNSNIDTDEKYIEIIDDTRDLSLYNDSYESSIGMTDEEALQLYNDYLSSLPNTLSESNTISIDYLETFADYAVEQGIIENTSAQRTGITKAIVRAEFKTVAKAGTALGFTTAGTLLNHSLQDNPSNLSYGANTTFASQISKSSECNSIVKSFKSSVKGKKVSSYKTTGSTTLNSTKDLHLAYNKVSYTASGTKKNGIWTLKIVFSDTYDFEKQAWKNAMTGNPAVTILNNYAAYAQSLKAIVPYKVKVTVTTTFKE